MLKKPDSGKAYDVLQDEFLFYPDYLEDYIENAKKRRARKKSCMLDNFMISEEEKAKLEQIEEDIKRQDKRDLILRKW